MKKILVVAAIVVSTWGDPAFAGTMFGALSNFDAVNDTGSPCNGFEIELEDIQARDVTYTFQYQRYGVPKITEDTLLVGGVPHPRTYVRWMSSYDQVRHVFVETTPVAPAGFQNTGGHLCFKNMTVQGQPYDTSGCEHFGVGTLKNPTNTVYRWMKEDPATPGSLTAQGSPVTIPAPVWSVNPAPNPGVNPNPVVAAVIPVPPPPAVVPVPYRPDAEFGVAVWAKVYETESEDPADLHHLVSDDEAVPGNDGPVPNPDAITEIEWQILQTDAGNPTKNELASERQIADGKESVTRRYEFYQYTGAYDVEETNEAWCTEVADDGKHGVGIHEGSGTDCGAMIVVGEYIGAQNAAANIAMALSANDRVLAHGEVGVRYPDRPLVFGGSGGPYSISFSGVGTLPATDPGNEFTLEQVSGVLLGGIPNGPGTATFVIHATDLVEPAQPPVDATFEITVVDAVAVDDIVVPDGAANVSTTVDLTASGGESPFVWTAVAVSPGLQASTLGNTLSLLAPAAGVYEVEVTVDDVLGGSDTRTLSYTVEAPLPPTSTPTEESAPSATPVDTFTEVPQPTPSETPADTASPTAIPTDTPSAVPTDTEVPTATEVPSATAVPSATEAPSATATSVPTATATNVPTATATDVPTATATRMSSPTATPPAATATPSLAVPPTATATLGSSPTPAGVGSLAVSWLYLTTGRGNSSANGRARMVGRIDDTTTGGSITQAALAGALEFEIHDADWSFDVSVPVNGCHLRRTAEIVCESSDPISLRLVLVPESSDPLPTTFEFRLRLQGLPPEMTGKGAADHNPMHIPVSVSLRYGGPTASVMMVDCREIYHSVIVCRERSRLPRQ